MNQNIHQSQEQSSNEPLAIRAAPPRASLGLKKRPVIIVTVVVMSIVGLAVIQAFSPRDLTRGQSKEDKRPAFLGDAVRGLPNDYSSIRRETPRLGARAINQHPAPEVNSVDKLAEELKALRLKQAAAAHAADISFSAAALPRSQNTQSNPAVPNMQQLEAMLGAPAAPNTRDDDNRQDDKAAFLKAMHNDSPYLPSLLHAPLSPYQLMAGSVVPGVLLTGINSDLPGQITGQVSQNIFDTVTGKYLLIPQGTKVIGEYDSRISYGQERVLVVWTRLLFPNGRSLSLEGMPGIDLSGYSGLHERVNNHYLKLLGGVVFGSLLGAGAQMAQGANHAADPSFGALAAQGTAQNINDVGQQITRKNLNLQPTLEISPGARFNVFVTKDLILEPYKP